MNVRRIAACIIVRVRERDDRWTKLAKEEFGVPDHVLRDSLARGDSVLLSVLIHISRETNLAGSWTSGMLSPLSKFDIHNTLYRTTSVHYGTNFSKRQITKLTEGYPALLSRFSVRFALTVVSRHVNINSKGSRTHSIWTSILLKT